MRRHAQCNMGRVDDGTAPPWVRPSTTATRALPVVWPTSLDVDSMPLPAPARSGGALPISRRLLGDWNRPKPAPHSASRQATLPQDAVAGISSDQHQPGHHDSQTKPAQDAG